MDDRKDLIDMAWQAIDDRNDIDVSLRDLAEAAIDIIDAPLMLQTLRRVLRDFDAMADEGLIAHGSYEYVQRAIWAPWRTKETGRCRS